MEHFGAYSNSQILSSLEVGHIVINPFNETQVNGSSYDVRLGEWYYKIKDKDSTKPAIFNPYDTEHIAQHFDGPYQAVSHEQIAEQLGIKPLKNIPLDTKVILFQPGERILGHTEEFIGIKPPGTTSMQARSTIGRLGINVCQDAGWGDPGYINRWTMELYNNNQLDPVILSVGTRIAQLVFYHTGAVIGEYSELSGNYQSVHSENLSDLITGWHPSQMLPKSLKVE
jgi:dCTP deaminase